MKRKRYSESFKAGAVKLVKEQGRSVPQAAKELGISASGLRRGAASRNHDMFIEKNAVVLKFAPRYYFPRVA